MCIFPIGATEACQHASALLNRQGISLVDHPTPEVTHLLLDIPSFRPDGCLRSGERMEPLLRMLPPDICILGGNLDVPMLDSYRKCDLLKNELYLAENAAITADCAIRLAGQYMKRTFSGAPALVIGWGRIGKCLSRLLRALGSSVTIAARKESDRAMANALGYRTSSIEDIPKVLSSFRLIFNTAPSLILTQPIPANCIALELASQPGLPETGVIPAGGLPGKLAPESSGALIAETIIKILQEGSL